MMNVEIEIGKERADGRGQRGRKEDHRGHEEHQRQQIAQQPQRKQRRLRFHLRHGLEQPPEKHDQRTKHRRRIERAEPGERQSERPHYVSGFTSSNHFIVDSARAFRACARSMPRAISRSMRREYLSSVASQSLGYMEMLVKPGMVLISLRKMRFVPRSRKKSTREEPDAPMAL